MTEDLKGKILELEEIEALWLEEADRRDQALDADPSRAIPGADVMREARALLLTVAPGQESRPT
jgi:putative addiction module component